SPDVRFVNHRVVPRNARRPVVAPGEGGIYHPALRCAGGAVAPVEGEIGLRLAQAIAEMRIAPDEGALQPLGVRLDQQFVGVESPPLLRAVGAVDPIAVEESRPGFGKIAVPDLIRAFAQPDALRLMMARLIKKAQLHLLRVGGEEREVDTLPIPGRTARIRLAGPDGADALRFLEDGRGPP